MSSLNRNALLVTMMLSLLLLQFFLTKFCKAAMEHDTGSSDDVSSFMGVIRPGKPTLDPNQMNFTDIKDKYIDAIKKRVNITASKKCGQWKTCKLSQYCCNPSCGICSPKNGACTTQVCNLSQFNPTPKSSPQRQRQLRTGSSPLPPTPTIPAAVLEPQFDDAIATKRISKGTGNNNEVNSPYDTKKTLPTAPVQCTCDSDCIQGMQCHTTSKTCRVLNRLPQPCGKKKM